MVAAEGAEVAAAAEAADVAWAAGAAARPGERAAGANADRFPIPLTTLSWPGPTKSTRPNHVLFRRQRACMTEARRRLDVQRSQEPRPSRTSEFNCPGGALLGSSKLRVAIS